MHDGSPMVKGTAQVLLRSPTLPEECVLIMWASTSSMWYHNWLAFGKEGLSFDTMYNNALTNGNFVVCRDDSSYPLQFTVGKYKLSVQEMCSTGEWGKDVLKITVQLSSEV
eukprot:m51a1_g13079 hypothetical protein (111) ;mRNA; f:2099-2431